ncbi:RHS repeat-associated core domain protein [Nocardiopsis alba ATCC BAA-2165]|uniref:RHS repeat-associated core domain protein n=2 Tax=Nocardiopsis alba TaxID=53437 RepID=J7KZC3_NOCAA|nr:RHS repeat-associated core domain protein [Nocardiopsis alba ATCC BAA-2165]
MTALLMVGTLLQSVPASSTTFNVRPETEDEESVDGHDVEGAFVQASEALGDVVDAAVTAPLTAAWPDPEVADVDLGDPGAGVPVGDGPVTVSQVSDEVLEEWAQELGVEGSEPEEASEGSESSEDPDVGPEVNTTESEDDEFSDEEGREQTPEGGEPLEEERVEENLTDQEDVLEETSPVVASVDSIQVEVLGRERAEDAGVAGLLLELTRTDGETAAGPVDITVDYSDFAHAYGGDYGGRLDIVAVDACSSEGDDACSEPSPQVTESDNDPLLQEVGATVLLAEGSTLIAVASDGEGDKGDYKATDLSASSSWEVGLQTGDFSWSYPMDTPPVASDLTPSVELSYSSGSVDGRVSSSNNQTSWIGEGFNYTPGFIERRYVPCAEKQSDSAKTGDLCWSHQNAIFSLNGRSGEMFQGEDGTWRMRHDDASKIERLTGATNGDDDGEHWKITTTDGTQYYFGLNRLPGYRSGNPETNSTWTVPVYGRDSGDPCNGSNFANSWCQQGWRWNLDYVVDPLGNAMTFYYAKERNHYGRNGQAGSPTPYDRGGHPTRIEYGLRSDDLYATAPARVNFAVSERCIPTDSFDCDPDKFTSANARHWPDAPFDQNCDSGQNCTNRLAPTFWSRKKLDSVTTQVHDGSSYQSIDSWTLDHSYPATGDGTPPDLWLKSISHKGHVGDTETMPTLEFGGTQFENRVDARDDGFAPMLKWRITSILTESGSRIDVGYASGECDPRDMPEPHANGTRCFPVINSTADGKSEYTDWFRKYVVTQVSEHDLVTDQPEDIVTYEYVGDAAWRFRDADGISREKQRTWSDWRGYELVRVTEGLSNQTRSQTEHRFFRGMHGDKLPSGNRDVKVTDSEGGEHTDHNQYNGFKLEEATLNGPGGDVVEKTINLPWSRVTGERRFSWGELQARMTGMASSTQFTAVDDGWTRTRETAEYDSLGRVTRVHDHGDLGDPDDDQCVETTYADNTSLHILDAVSRTRRVAVGCDSEATVADVLSDTRSLFDGGGFGEAPTRGLATEEQRIEDHDGSTPVYQTVERSEHDDYGRTISETDPLGNTTTTTYASNTTGGNETSVTTTNPLGHTETVLHDGGRGLPLTEIDANGNRTDFAYDPFGRLTEVWTPDKQRGQGGDPAMRFEYHISNEEPSVVVTHTRRDDGTYVSGYQIYDGLLRERQSQDPAPGGGRVISETFRDSRGLEVKERHAYHNEEDPGRSLFVVANEDSVPRYTETVYDGAERPTEVITFSRGREMWRTVSEDRGDRQSVTPAEGAIPTTTIKDVRGQTVELRQHEGDGPDADYTALTYTYTPAGQLETVTDPAGNVWRNHYDLRGRKIRTDDPDRGTTTFVYDDADRPVSTTDARGETVAHVYDELGRKTAQHAGDTDGPLLASWTFDTVAKGELTRATRYVDGKEYTTSVGAYDSLGRATATSIGIPRDEDLGGLSGTYRFRTTYNSDGTIRTNTYPAMGGLPEEIVSYGYNELGMPTRVRGLTEAESLYYVNDTVYSKLGLVLQREFYRGDGSTSPKRTWSTRTYETSTNRMLSARVHHEIGHGSLVEQHYSYDPAGNVLSIRDEPTAVEQSDVQCFDYDEMRRLISEWTSKDRGEDACASAPSPDNVGGASPYWYDYTYDALGNRTGETRHGVMTDSSVVNTFHRPEAGEARPHAVTERESSGDDNTSTYSYDEAGNMVSRKTGHRDQTLEWDAEGQLVGVRDGTNKTSFVYDAEGERLLRDDGNTVTLYLPGTEITYHKNDLVMNGTRFYEHNDEVVASRSATGQVHWIFSDHHKTGQLALDSVTGESIRRRFTAFGIDRGTAGGTWPNSRGFVGGVVDEGIGLTRLGARSYDEELGSFISADPVIDFGDSQQMHGFSYANNSPVSFTDPDGLFLRRTFARARAWAAQRARQAAIRAYRIRQAAIRAWRIRQAAIRAHRIRQAAIRAARIRAAQARMARIRAAQRRAAAMRAAALRRAAAQRAARARAARIAAERRRQAAIRRSKVVGEGPRKLGPSNGREEAKPLGLYQGPLVHSGRPRKGLGGSGQIDEGIGRSGSFGRQGGINSEQAREICTTRMEYRYRVIYGVGGIGVGGIIGGNLGGGIGAIAGIVGGPPGVAAGAITGAFSGALSGAGIGYSAAADRGSVVGKIEAIRQC